MSSRLVCRALAPSVLVAALGLGCVDSDRSGPVPEEVEPRSVIEGKAVQITIRGERFVQRVETDFGSPALSELDDAYAARLGEVPLRDVERVSDTELRATVPAGMTAGCYPLEVTDPWGGQGTLPEAFTILPLGHLDPDEVDRLRVLASGPQVAGQPFAVQIVAVDPAGTEDFAYSATLTLSDVTGTLTPALVPLVHGRWSGLVEVRASAAEEVLSAQDAAGHQGRSDPFPVEPRPATALCFATPARRLVAGSCSAALVVQTCDDLGQAADPPQWALPLQLTLDPPGAATTFLAADCEEDAAAPIELGASGSVSIHLRSPWAGTLQLEARATGLRPASQRVEVVPGSFAALTVISRGQSLLVSRCSQEVVAELEDALGNAVTLPTAVSLLLDSGPSGLRYFSDPACQLETSEVEVASGQSQVGLWFSGNVSGQAPLRISGPGVPDAVQVETLLPEAPEALVFVTPPATTTAGTCSNEVRVQVQDRFGNPSPVPSERPLKVSAAPSEEVRLFGDLGCSSPLGAPSLSPGTAEAGLFFAADRSGPLLLSVAAVGVTSASQIETVLPAPPRALAFVNDPVVIKAGGCIPAILESRDPLGNPSPVDTLVPISLAASAPGTAFFSDAACTSAVAGARFDPGSSRSGFFAQATVAGPLVLLATVGGWVPASQTETVEPEAPARVVVASAAQNLLVGGCSAPVLAQIKDRFGNLSPLSPASPFKLAATPAAGLTFFADSQCSTELTGPLPVGPSGDQASFHFLSTRAGAVSVTVSLAELIPASQCQTLVAAPPDHLALLTDAQTVTAGACSAPVEVESRDAFGNPSPAVADTLLHLESAPVDRLGLFADASCAVRATERVLAAGSSRLRFYFKSTLAGAAAVHLAAPPWPETNQLEVIAPGPTSAFRIAPLPSPLLFDAAFPVTARAVDAFGNTTPGFAGQASLSILPSVPLTCVSSCSAPLTTEAFSNGVWAGALAVSSPGGRSEVLTLSSGPVTGVSNPFDVLAPEAPPQASFSATPVVAVVGAPVSFDAAASRDGQTPASELEVSWDFEGSASPPPWTAWSTAKQSTYTFAEPGAHAVRLAVRDLAGTLGYTSRLVRVVAAGSTDVCTISTTDVDLDDGASSCAGPFGTDGKLSLKEALKIANTSAATEIITFSEPMTLTQNSTYALTKPVELYAPAGTVFQHVNLLIKASTILSGLEVTGLQAMLRVDSEASLTVVDSYLHDGQGIRASGTVVLERARLENCSAACVRVDGDANAELTVRDSEIRDASVGIHLKQCSRQTPVLDLQSTVLSGLDTAVWAEAACASPALLRNNTFFDALTAVSLDAGTGHVLRNNVFAEIASKALVVNTAQFAARDFHVLFANGDDAALAGDPRTLRAEPLFVDAARGDLRLQAASPCRDTAFDDGLDLNGLAPGLWFGAAPDRGGRESW
ncbi:MAG: PKD domain-containing protein [Myxococcales bacterium]